MSRREDSVPGPERAALAQLEEAVGRALERIRRLESRLVEAEHRGEELERLLTRFQSGDEHPQRLAERLSDVTRENDAMRGRMEEGRAGVERLLARIRFLEEQR